MNYLDLLVLGACGGVLLERHVGGWLRARAPLWLYRTVL